MGSTGRGGKPKGQRKYSWRDWRPDEDTTLKTMIDEGLDYAAIGEKLGRSTYRKPSRAPPAYELLLLNRAFRTVTRAGLKHPR